MLSMTKLVITFYFVDNFKKAALKGSLLVLSFKILVTNH